MLGAEINGWLIKHRLFYFCSTCADCLTEYYVKAAPYSILLLEQELVLGPERIS